MAINGTVIDGSTYPAFSSEGGGHNILVSPYNEKWYIVYSAPNELGWFQIYVRKSSDEGLTWGDAILVNDPAMNTQNNYFPSMAIQENNGKVHIAYTGKDRVHAGDWDILYNTVTLLDTAGTEAVVAHVDNYDQDYPCLCLDYWNRPNIAYEGNGYGTYPTKNQIMVTKKLVSWQEPDALTDLNNHQYAPSILPRGQELNVVWYGAGHAPYTVKWAVMFQQSIATAFRSIELASDNITANSINYSNVRIGTSLDGILYIVFKGSDNTIGLVYQTETGWSDIETVVTSDDAYAEGIYYYPRICFDRWGSMHILWSEWVGDYEVMSARTRVASGRWTEIYSVTWEDRDEVSGIYSAVIFGDTGVGDRPATLFAIADCAYDGSEYIIGYFPTPPLNNAGAIWIEGTELHYIDENGKERYMEGALEPL